MWGMRKAAVLVIGNEVLNGTTVDTNSRFAAGYLWENGIDLDEIRVIKDDVDVIAHAIHDFGDLDYVITSGGIGSTHDDVTYLAVANAFSTQLAYSEEIIDVMKSVVPEEYINEAMLKMALVPRESDLYFMPEFFSPLAKLENVYMCPGVPQLFKKMLVENSFLFDSDKNNLLTKRVVYTNLGETRFAAHLEQLSLLYDQVEIGSYPNTKEAKERTSEDDYRVKITLSGMDESLVEKVQEQILEISSGWTK